jgi:hypothetical protein
MTEETITPEGPEPARDYTCKHCGAEGLTKAEQLAHGRQHKRTGQCMPDAELANEPEAEQEATPVMSPEERAARDDQIRDYAQALCDRQFLHRLFISSEGARRIAALVLEDNRTLDEAACIALPGFAGWAEGQAQQ